jgi:hypothetical protein
MARAAQMRDSVACSASAISRTKIIPVNYRPLAGSFVNPSASFGTHIWQAYFKDLQPVYHNALEVLNIHR